MGENASKLKTALSKASQLSFELKVNLLGVAIHQKN